jgi:hypothetical protein
MDEPKESTIMNILRCFRSGLGRVVGSPSLVFWLYLSSLAIALPLTAAMRETLRTSIGSSMVDQNLNVTFDLDWYGEYSAGARGFAATFSPAVVGILPVLHDLERLLNGEILNVDRVVLAAGILYLLAWAFFGGGIVARYASPDEPRYRDALFGTSAQYFFRFVRLLVISLTLYWALFRWIAGPVYSWLERVTRDVTAEREMMAYTILFYVLVAFLLLICSLAMDYAKVAMVVEERRSAVLAFVRGLKFACSRPLQTGGLYLLLALTGILLLLVYGAAAPGAGQSSYSALALAFLVSQLFLLARLILRLWFLASETALFQSALEKKRTEAPPLPEPVAGVS